MQVTSDQVKNERTGIPNPIDGQGRARKHVGFTIALIQCHKTLTDLIADQRGTREPRLLPSMPIQRHAGLFIADIESRDRRVVRHLFAGNMGFTAAIHVSPRHKVLFTQHWIVRLLFPLALGYSARIRRI